MLVVVSISPLLVSGSHRGARLKENRTHSFAVAQEAFMFQRHNIAGTILSAALRPQPEADHGTSAFAPQRNRRRHVNPT
jgi:hypothetical protein